MPKPKSPKCYIPLNLNKDSHSLHNPSIKFSLDPPSPPDYPVELVLSLSVDYLLDSSSFLPLILSKDPELSGSTLISPLVFYLDSSSDYIDYMHYTRLLLVF